ncbi:ABC transporter permease [Mycobacterium hodleri]|uniref:ABC transporter permease n=1 Tax=Mycolicibacterium hodleri TaxID=49897 RepID=A0A544VWH7_9MYCO|nr:ABC transporter permease [Mycolicibacterium hodleri]
MCGSERGIDVTTSSANAAVIRARYPRTTANLGRYAGAPRRAMDSFGQMVWFTLVSIGQIPLTLRRYRAETTRLIAQIGMGTGALAVIGGTLAIVAFITLSGASLVAIQGFSSLGNIGVDVFTGFFAALVNVRIAAPVVTGIALAATVGAGATAELGAMRISEEIDALEVMGVKSLAFLASTRIIAAVVVILPLYGLAMIMAFLSPQLVTTLFYGQSSGTYNHYFRTFLRPEDVYWSFLVAVIIATVVMITHCFYGYTAAGGPVGVGDAVGRSMRFSLAAVVIVAMLSSLALYGVDPNFNLSV